MKKVWDSWLDAEDNPPTQNGYYAVLGAWPSDPFEGYFPQWGLWHENKWETAYAAPVSHRSPDCFQSKEEAEKWASEHDPEE